MTTVRDTTAPVRHADRLFIDGAWVEPSSDATIDVIDSGPKSCTTAHAGPGPDDVIADGAARRPSTRARGPGRHCGAAEVLTPRGGIQERGDVLGQLWPRETGTIYKNAVRGGSVWRDGAVRRPRRHVSGRRSARRRPAASSGCSCGSRSGRGRDHPLERTVALISRQDRGAPRRVHRGAQVRPRGAGEDTCRRGRRGDRPHPRRSASSPPTARCRS